MAAVAENRNVQRALAMMERDLKQAAIEYQTYGARRSRLEELQATHRDYAARLLSKPMAVMPVRPSGTSTTRRAA